MSIVQNIRTEQNQGCTGIGVYVSKTLTHASLLKSGNPQDRAALSRNWLPFTQSPQTNFMGKSKIVRQIPKKIFPGFPEFILVQWYYLSVQRFIQKLYM
ncbi:hypothetical protein ACX27_12225 [Nostoc piscinale CENA21]|uniref:Uncharacterized protein n=1 Tax=Nostoc piscinale CENA21 TaxID=224013 RepID=A0A0M4SKU4_9NOSO|nr:hypothetical protein ACX27_12225 [Nostoc piscinale CENA21]